MPGLSIGKIERAYLLALHFLARALTEPTAGRTPVYILYDSVSMTNPESFYPGSPLPPHMFHFARGGAWLPPVYRNHDFDQCYIYYNPPI